MTRLSDPPQLLPCGVALENRIIKSGLSEKLGNHSHQPSPELIQVYRRWGQGGAGLLISGCVMIDPLSPGDPRDVVLERGTDLTLFNKWAMASRAPIWLQITHPGVAVTSTSSESASTPSFSSPSVKKLFKDPEMFSQAEIYTLIEKFATSALLAKEAGFAGVQIHALSEHLIGQFLSNHNLRKDHWGGSLKNRMRLLLEVYQAIRQQVGPHFPIGLKLTPPGATKSTVSKEFFSVLKTLSTLGLDLIEIVQERAERSRIKDNFKSSFRKHAHQVSKEIRTVVDCPVLLTGGFLSTQSIRIAIESDCADFVGVGRGMAVEPDLPRKVFSDSMFSVSLPALSTGIHTLDRLFMLDVTWYENQIAYLGQGKEANVRLHPVLSVVKSLRQLGFKALAPRRL